MSQSAASLAPATNDEVRILIVRLARSTLSLSPALSDAEVLALLDAETYLELELQAFASVVWGD